MNSEHSEHSGPHRIVRASAGTGKTHRLSTRYVELLRSGASVESILASTFTRKAAGEILGRVLSRLAEASLDRVAARDLAQELGGCAFGPKAASRLLRSLCDELHRTSISTLDAFFFRVAAMLRFELGLRSKPRMSSIDDPLERARRQDALEDTLDRLADSGLSELLDLLQRLHRDSARSSISFALDGLLKDLYETFAQAPGIDAWSRLEVPTAPDSDRVRSAVDLLSRAAGGTAQAGLRKALAGNVEDAERGAWARLLERGLAAKVAAGESSYRAKPIPDAWVEALEVLVGRARHEGAREGRGADEGHVGDSRRLRPELRAVEAPRQRSSLLRSAARASSLSGGRGRRSPFRALLPARRSRRTSPAGRVPGHESRPVVDSAADRRGNPFLW